MSLAAAAALTVAIAADPSGALTQQNSATEFAAAIERYSAIDPHSPYTLNARLDYAAFLAHDQTGGCDARLDRALSELDLVKANPVLDATLPAGLARAADVDYQIHSARVACGGPDVRDAELRAALESAQRAVELYRSAFDAVSMATMQFNSSVAYHDLGDSAAAVAALQEAIAMDREYGYEQDAEDNYALLLQWQKQPATPEQVEARMQDFPERSVTLAFDWSPSVAKVDVESDYTQVADGQVVKVHGARSAQRSVSKSMDSWHVSFQTSPAHFDLASPPPDDPSLQALGTSLANALLRFHDFELARDGDFDDDAGTFKFVFRVRADAKQLARDLDTRGAAAAPLMQRVSKALGALQRSDVIESLVAEDYNFDTGTWIGATLEQGVWYTMTAWLSLLLDPRAFVKHDIEFAYTRPVACFDDARGTACVEIVLRATPDAAELKNLLGKLAGRRPPGQSPQLQSNIEMRLIVDPITLVAYRRDTRRYSYWWDGAAGPKHALTESEKTSMVGGKLTPAVSK